LAKKLGLPENFFRFPGNAFSRHGAPWGTQFLTLKTFLIAFMDLAIFHMDM